MTLPEHGVPVLVLTGYGLNCEAETTAAFSMVGGHPSQMHVTDFIDQASSVLPRHRIVALIGGFSFGDHIASGRVFANRLRFRVGQQLARYVDDGGLIIGICNGFQTLVKMGLLPALGRRPGAGLAQQVSLISNDRMGYRDAWVRLAVDAQSPCVFTRGLSDEVVELPSRHGEGKFLYGGAEQRADIERRHLVPLRYADREGRPTEIWPDNPNGSPGGAASLCDPSGRVFGLMPHPEAYLYPHGHPRWLQQRYAGTLPDRGLGLRMLENGVRAAAEGR